MKKAIYFILILSSFNCRSDINQNIVKSKENNKEIRIEQDSVFYLKRLSKKIVNTDYIRFKEVVKFDIYKDTVYSFYENKILKIDTISLSSNLLSFNPSLFTESNKIINYDYIFNIKNNINGYQLVNYNSLINYNEEEKITENVYLIDNVIFNTLKEDYSMLCDYKKVTLVNNDLALLDEVNFDFIDSHFIESDNGFFYCDDYSESLIHFSVVDKKIVLIKKKPLSEIIGVENLENFNIELITDRHIIGAYYDDYSNIFFINRNSYQLENMIFIGKEFEYSNKNLDQFSPPNFQLIFKHDKYYFMGLDINNNLIIGSIGQYNNR